MVIFNVSNVNDVPEMAGLSAAITDADIATPLVKENLTAVFTVTAPADEDGDNNFTYKFYWNNGTTADQTVGPLTNATFTVAHAFAATGNYTVKLVVEDGNGGKNTTYLVVSIIKPVDKPKQEWWPLGWGTDDKTGDSAVAITFTTCTMTIKVEKDKPTAGKSTMTTTYSFSGTCGSEVTKIFIYQASQKNADAYIYYPFADPEDVLQKLEITPSGGTWSYAYTDTFEHTTTDITVDDDDATTDTYTIWFAAVGWTEDGKYNWAEKQVAAGTTGDDDDDDDDNMMMYAIIGGAVLLVIIIVVVIIIVIMMMKKKKAAAEQAPPAPAPGTEGQPAPGAGPAGPEAQAPVMCQCGNQIPVGSPNCPVCGAPAPAPAPAAAPQVDQYGQPIQQQPPMDQQPQTQQAPPQGYPPQQQMPPQGQPQQPGYPPQQQPGYPPQQ
jgi:hypothetical protein